MCGKNIYLLKIKWLLYPQRLKLITVSLSCFLIRFTETPQLQFLLHLPSSTIYSLAIAATLRSPAPPLLDLALLYSALRSGNEFYSTTFLGFYKIVDRYHFCWTGPVALNLHLLRWSLSRNGFLFGGDHLSEVSFPQSLLVSYLSRQWILTINQSKGIVRSEALVKIIIIIIIFL